MGNEDERVVRHSDGLGEGGSGWKSVISASGRVGANGVTNGATSRQNTSTTPTGTSTITEGFGVEYGGTTMPYTRVASSHWWVQDTESAYYNSMHTAAGADFPLVETGDRGSEHLINYPTQYAKALVIDFNRWPGHARPPRAPQTGDSGPSARMSHQGLSHRGRAGHPRRQGPPVAVRGRRLGRTEPGEPWCRPFPLPPAQCGPARVSWMERHPSVMNHECRFAAVSRTILEAL
ncbi:hypothetical protein ACFU9X_10130 [Streptomyces atratus]|uniref:hypothetical protein n=1 Tax=Streptomyces atratus TaxID=1893 RepID=UPI003675BC85